MRVLTNRVNRETTGGCSNGKTPKSSRGVRDWSRSNGKNAGADEDKAIMNTANSIADHLKESRPRIRRKTVCLVGVTVRDPLGLAR